jgi:hypothetical protein
MGHDFDLKSNPTWKNLTQIQKIPDPIRKNPIRYVKQGDTGQPDPTRVGYRPC